VLKQEQSAFLRSTRVHGITLSFIDALDERVDWENPRALVSDYAGVIFGGSGDFYFDGSLSKDHPDRMRSYIFTKHVQKLVEYIMERDMPFLGICYGHQMVAHLQGVDIAHQEPQAKTGSYNVIVHEAGKNDPLLTDIPDTFFAQYGHKDSLKELPRGATLLAHGGPHCGFSMLRYGRHVYTVQFHPELEKGDIVDRMKASPGYLPEGVDINDVIVETPHASRILSNFYSRVILTPVAMPEIDAVS